MAKRRANGEGTLRKRKDGRWEARYTDTRESDPNKRKKSIINKSQKVVVEKLKLVLAKIPSGVRLLSSKNSTLSEWLYIWMKEYKLTELRDSTYECYNMNIRVYINPLLGHIKLKSLTGFDIQKVYNLLQRSKENGGYNLKSASVIKIKNILSGALKQAMKNRIIVNNPLSETSPTKIEENKIRILSKLEQKRFIDVLPLFNMGNMLALALLTGLRLGELCALEIGDINRDQKYIDINKSASRHKDKYTGEVSIKVGPVKIKKSVRKIPLLLSIEIILYRQEQLVEKMKKKARKRWKKNNLVFPTDMGNIHDASDMRSSMGRILKCAELPHFTIHSFRHTFATNALNSGVAPQNVARLLGHKNGATTLIFYAHYLNNEAILQLRKLEEQNLSFLGITEDKDILMKAMTRYLVMKR